MKNTDIALSTAEILLPKQGLSLEKWAVVACDQFTAEPSYWAEAEMTAKGVPSALWITLPEIYLNERSARVPGIHASMREYLGSALAAEVPEGFVLVERGTSAGLRQGLLACVDLEKYDFSKGSESLIRATEGTVPERVPPRAEIRSEAPLECPHVMMLIDDPECSVIEPALSDPGRLLYDFDLMLGGGHIRGWALEDGRARRVFDAVARLAERAGGLLFAVGDGNHSLAAAKQCWASLRETLSSAELESHPARWALVELVNLHCPALVFEPIHRALFNADPEAVLAEWRASGAFRDGGEDVRIAFGDRVLGFSCDGHPIRPLQDFLDGFLKRRPEAEIDDIHGDESLLSLACRENTVGFMPRAFDKAELFPYIRKYGVLPRKTFSMGHARDKRYYLEARRIVS